MEQAHAYAPFYTKSSRTNLREDACFEADMPLS
jgi:hypothetical protein